MSRESASTIGAAASKNERRALPVRSEMASASVAEHSGPAAMTTGPSGMDETSLRITSIRSRCAICFSTHDAKTSRSTANAPPAGTDALLAHSRSTEPNCVSSRFNIPAAESSRSDFKELEQTSSARCPVWCAADILCGLISYSRTRTPRSAS